VKRDTREWVASTTVIRSPVPMPGHPHGVPRPAEYHPNAQSHSPLNTLVDAAVALRERDRDREREKEREAEREREREGLERTMADSFAKKMYSMQSHHAPDDPRYPPMPQHESQVRPHGHPDRYQPMPRFSHPGAVPERYLSCNMSFFLFQIQFLCSTCSQSTNHVSKPNCPYLVLAIKRCTFVFDSKSTPLTDHVSTV
jgi:hypothetical protein